MPYRAALSAHGDEIFKNGAAGYTGLRSDNTVPSDYHVMRNLHEIVDLCALADDRILERAPVDGGVRADLDVVLDDDAADLPDLIMAAWPHGEAEAVLADARRPRE